MNAILKEDPAELTAGDLEPRSSREQISPALERVVRRCLEKRPEARFQSASDLAFALRSLSEGSGARTINGVSYNSPTCNGSTVTGIGQAAAGKIWYRALTVYMTSSTNYAGARTATLNAAKDLYGAGSVQQNAVAAAWSAVAVN